MGNKREWLEKQLKVGEIKLQPCRKSTDRSPNLNGVMRTEDGTIHYISLWKVRINEDQSILTGNFKTKEQSESDMRAARRYNVKQNLEDFLPD